MAKDAAYQAAEKKIEAARRSGATELDLSVGYDDQETPKLTELPESLSQLAQLRKLDLSRNRLAALPESLGQLTQLQELNLSNNQLTALPESLGQLTQLQQLDLTGNRLAALPESLGQLTQLQELDLPNNQLTALPESLGQLRRLKNLNLPGNRLQTLPESAANLLSVKRLVLCFNNMTVVPEGIAKLGGLEELHLHGNALTSLPDFFGNFKELRTLYIDGNRLTSLPSTFFTLDRLEILDLGTKEVGGNEIADLPTAFLGLRSLNRFRLDENPLKPELAAAYKEGLDAVKRYLRAKAEAQVVLNEAKLVFVGEGGVGKSSLLGALCGEQWQEKRDSTHGVETKSLSLPHPTNGSTISFNAWDFGGQPIYRPTHQIFFTAPAVYVAVWDPRRGPEQCCVEEWIQMVKHRTYDEQRPESQPRVLVVATNGGPKERRDHIDEDGLRKLFGGMIVSFHHVDSKTGHGMEDLKKAIAQTAAGLPNVGRTVAASWKKALDMVRDTAQQEAYITYSKFQELCAAQQVEDGLTDLYASMMNELGHLIHYGTDGALKEIVILKPEWLSKAISFILEDSGVKEQSGLVEHRRLGELWDDSAKAEQERYPSVLHPVFLRLMERFELSYRVVLPEQRAEMPTGTRSTIEAGTSLVAQLVPGKRPERLAQEWPETAVGDDSERVQVCRISDRTTGQPSAAAGLLYRLIVRLHRYSLGRSNYRLSCHWQKGLLVDDGYNGRGLLEEIGGDIRVTVRAAYPERLLHYLCEDVKYLVDSGWKGLNCQITVPCIPPCQASLEVEALIQSRREHRPEYPCPVCRKWLRIDALLSSSPPMPDEVETLGEIRKAKTEIIEAVNGSYVSLSKQLRVHLSQIDVRFDRMMRTLLDEAKEGPRLFSLLPVDRSVFNPNGWVKQRFKVTLWCEHSRMPVYVLSNDEKAGVYEFDVSRDWYVAAAPFLKGITGVLSLVLPVASSLTKLALDETVYKGIEKQLEAGKSCAEAMLKGAEKTQDWLDEKEGMDIEPTVVTHARGGVLRQLHAWLKEKDPSFGGLVRVMNRRQEFLWVHPLFEKEY